MNPTRRSSSEGTIVEILLRNPHSFLQVDAPDENGQMQRWSLEWRSSGSLGQQGIKRDTLKIGDAVTVTLNPSRTARGSPGRAKDAAPQIGVDLGWGSQILVKPSTKWGGLPTCGQLPIGQAAVFLITALFCVAPVCGQGRGGGGRGGGGRGGAGRGA